MILFFLRMPRDRTREYRASLCWCLLAFGERPGLLSDFVELTEELLARGRLVWN